MKNWRTEHNGRDSLLNIPLPPYQPNAVFASRFQVLGLQEVELEDYSF